MSGVNPKEDLKEKLLDLLNQTKTILDQFISSDETPSSRNPSSISTPEVPVESRESRILQEQRRLFQPVRRRNASTEVGFASSFSDTNSSQNPTTSNQPVIDRTFPRYHPYASVRSRSAPRHKHKNVEKTFKKNIFALNDKNQDLAPTIEQRIMLEENGLGLKVVEFLLNRTANDVKNTIQNAFPRLLEAGGGFDVLTTASGSRTQLTVWSKGPCHSAFLKRLTNTGRIYIRPIQKDLDLKDTEEAPAETLI